MKKLDLKRQKPLNKPITNEVDREVRGAKREWRHLVQLTDENHLLFTAFVILLAAAVIINTAYVLNHNSLSFSTRHTKTIIVPDSSAVLTSLQIGSNSAETVKVSKVTENNNTDYAFAIDPSETMLIMDFSITNNTPATQQLIPVNQLYVRSRTGDYANLHASMYVTTPLSATELAPGKTATGELSFNVPKSVAHPLLYVDTGWDKNVPLVFDVLH